MKPLKPRGDVKNKIKKYIEGREVQEIRNLLDKAEEDSKKK